MFLISALSIVFIVLMFFGYNSFIQTTKPVMMGAKQQEKVNWWNLVIILVLGLIVRYVLAKIDSGYEVDMNCFSYWSDQVYNDGFAAFYNSGTFADYPPGYMYILWVVGLFRHAFPALAGSTVALKMPAMLCDLLTGVLVYKIANRRFDSLGATFLTCLYVFNPVVLIDSAMWGQVDSVFTLFVAIMIYLVAEKKLIPAYFVFAIGILVKPQTLILTPILGLGILDQVFFHNFSAKKFFKNLGFGLLAIVLMYVCVLPYAFDVYWVNYAAKTVAEGTIADTFLPVTGNIAIASTSIFTRGIQSLLGAIALYAGTLTSYKFVTVNAYNFWEIFKLNWHDQAEIGFGLPYSTWGTIFIVLICLGALVVSILNRKSQNGSKYFFLGAFIVAGFFTLSVRVHERYMFPAFVLLLLAYLYKPKREYILLYLSLVFAQVSNIWHAFKFYDPNNFDWEAMYPRVIGAIHAIIFVCFVVILVKNFVLKRDEIEKETEDDEVLFVANTPEAVEERRQYWKPRRSDEKIKFTKFDWIAIVAITIIYGVIALYNLGDKDAPQTHWETRTPGDCITLDFSNKTANLTSIAYYDGYYENREFYLEESADGVNWTAVAVNGQDVNSLGGEAAKFSMSSVFCWGTASFYSTQPFLRLRCISNETVLNELVFFDETGAVVTPVNAEAYAALFDENVKYPGESTFRDSTYFDEIYHARTAYEMTQNVYNYEWTHPPLGKFIISIGVRIFGMCPFGWRIMGTLFGIAMLPIFYLFTRRLFGKTWISTVTTVLFAADFMHFAQTRIATIDVYVTFFIILMYYFMYRYYRMSFNDTPLVKTFIPLLLCGISMGLGCACKWPGVYAGIGLAVIFFYTIFVRFMEYRYACNDPDGESNGISHDKVIKNFLKNILYTFGFCVLAFVIIPGSIYTLSYIPFNNGTDMGLIQRMLKNQIDMWEYHSDLDATHPFSSTWYEWPIMKRPIWYYNKTLANGLQENISAFGNPAVWWAGIPAFLYMLFRVVTRKDKKATFLCIGYLAQLIPWTGVTRCTFIYHYFPSVPFVVIMVGYSMYCLAYRTENEKTRRTVIISCMVYAAIVVGLFAMFYPVLSGYPIHAEYALKWLRWFKDSWVLVSG